MRQLINRTAPVAVALATGLVLLVDYVLQPAPVVAVLYVLPLLLTWFIGVPLVSGAAGVALSALCVAGAFMGGPPAATTLLVRVATAAVLLLFTAVLVRALQLRRAGAESEAQRQVSDATLRANFSVTGVGQAQTDTSTRRFTRVNQAFCDYLGYTEAELLQLTLDDVNHPDHRDEDRDRYQRVLAGDDQYYRATKRYVRKDGTVVWAVVNGGIVRDAAGTPLAGFAIVQDITPLKKLQSACQAAEQRLQLALAAAQAGTWEWDPATDAVTLDVRMQEICGIDGEGFAGTGAELMAMVHPDDRARVAAATARAVQECGDYAGDFRILRKDGSVHWLRNAGRTVLHGDGPGCTLVGLGIEITNEREATIRLAEDNARLGERVSRRDAELAATTGQLDLVMQATLDGVWDWDPGRDALEVSPRWRDMHGFGPDEALTPADKWDGRIDPRDRGRVAERLSAYLQRRHHEFWEEYRVRRVDGSLMWVLDRGTALWSDDGRAVRMVGAETDISWRKQAEEQIRSLSGRLLRVQDEERRRIARDLHDDFTQRLAGIAIELRQLKALAGDGLAEPLESLQSAVQGLTGDLQTLARDLHPSILDHAGLEPAVRDLADDYHRRHGLPVAVITRRLPRQVPVEQATCLYRVTQESLRNVVTHAGASCATIRLLATPRGLGVCVHDDGRGIEAAAGVHGRGKGLGLNSMAERVALLGGRFHVRSRPGEGTEVHAWLPLPVMTPCEDVPGGSGLAAATPDRATAH